MHSPGIGLSVSGGRFCSYSFTFPAFGAANCVNPAHGLPPCGTLRAIPGKGKFSTVLALTTHLSHSPVQFGADQDPLGRGECISAYYALV